MILLFKIVKALHIDTFGHPKLLQSLQVQDKQFGLMSQAVALALKIHHQPSQNPDPVLTLVVLDLLLLTVDSNAAVVDPTVVVVAGLAAVAAAAEAEAAVAAEPAAAVGAAAAAAVGAAAAVVDRVVAPVEGVLNTPSDCLLYWSSALSDRYSSEYRLLHPFHFSCILLHEVVSRFLHSYCVDFPTSQPAPIHLLETAALKKVGMKNP